jgi:hypothetical protein
MCLQTSKSCQLLRGFKKFVWDYKFSVAKAWRNLSLSFKTLKIEKIMFNSKKLNTMVINRCDITEIEAIALNKQGNLNILPFSSYEGFDENVIRSFLHIHGIYVLPTLELIEFLKKEIQGPAIEIGCGNGAIGRALRIPLTDLKLQDETEYKFYYAAHNIPTIKYPPDVLKFDAIEAIEYYKPKTVIGAFITHKFNGVSGNARGPVEGKILRLVNRYIHIGNNQVHGNKPILKHPHQELYFNWLITRGFSQIDNRILIFDKVQ